MPPATQRDSRLVRRQEVEEDRPWSSGFVRQHARIANPTDTRFKFSPTHFIKCVPVTRLQTTRKSKAFFSASSAVSNAAGDEYDFASGTSCLSAPKAPSPAERYHRSKAYHFGTFVGGRG